MCVCACASDLVGTGETKTKPTTKPKTKTQSWFWGGGLVPSPLVVHETGESSFGLRRWRISETWCGRRARRRLGHAWAPRGRIEASPLSGPRTLQRATRGPPVGPTGWGAGGLARRDLASRWRFGQQSPSPTGQACARGRLEGALPHRRLVELLVRVREGPAVAGHGEGGAGPPAEDLARDGVQRAGEAGLRAGGVGVRDHIRVPLVLGRVVPGEGGFQGSQRGRAGAGGRDVAGVGGGLRLRGGAVREEVVVAPRTIVVALVVCGGRRERRVRNGRGARSGGGRGLAGCHTLGRGGGARSGDHRNNTQNI